MIQAAISIFLTVPGCLRSVLHAPIVMHLGLLIGVLNVSGFCSVAGAGRDAFGEDIVYGIVLLFVSCSCCILVVLWVKTSSTLSSYSLLCF